MSRLQPPRDPSEALLWRTRIRLSALTLLLVTTLVVVMGATTAVVATTLMHQSVDRALDAAANDSLTLHELFEDEEEYEYVGPLTEADTFAMLVDAEGNVYGNTTNADLGDLPDMEAVAAAASGIDRRSGRYGDTELRLRTASLGPVEIEDELDVRTMLFIQAGHDLSLQRELEQQLLVAITLVGLAGIGGAILVTLFVTRRALVPIREAFDTERRFVATASHELRTPVAIIRASAEILEREDLVEAEGEPLVDDIVGETDRLGRLVGDLLVLASAEAGAIPVERRRLEVGAYFGDIARRCASMAEARGIDFESSAAGTGTPAHIEADRDRLDQIVIILVDNAFNHSPSNGLVHLDLAVDALEREATILVSDEGPGIDPAEAERIFEPFARKASGRTTDEGAGLGLAIATQLARRHEATLDVQSEPGQGATFRLRLPLATDQPRENA